ncbi:MAG TPA: Ig-like domain-containing protein [Gemmatimonadales bacterium]|nr:Ig-like domain-containing protein [Gemmatimonadales bacterium]
MAHAARRPGRQVSGARLRLIALASVALGACARTGEPPGGPPDVKAPVIIGVYPESGAVVSDLHADAVIQYDDVIDEMGGGGTAGGTTGAATGLATKVLLSPTRGAYKVSWHRSAIHVKPAEGWKPGRVYHLEILPGISDLRRNSTKDRRTIIFSTGPPVPTSVLQGSVVQWVEQHILPNGLVRAQLLPDTIAYLAVTDSVGHFRLDAIPPGRYLVYAIVDQNNNRQRDRREAYDSAVVTLDTTASFVLWTFVHDSIGPRVRQVDAIDSVTARLTFSQPLDPAQPLDSLGVRVLALPDSTPLQIARRYSSADYDSVAARERAVADSIRAANDTTKKAAPPPKKDTTVDTTGRAVPIAPKPAVDTSALRALLRQRPVPQDKIVLRVETPLKPEGKYFVEVRGARNLNGARADGHTVLVVPKPKPPPTAADSAKAAADSLRRRAAPRRPRKP